MKQSVDIEARVAGIVSTTTRMDLVEAHYDEGLHLDSLAVLEVTIALEKEYGISVDDESVDVLSTFRSVRTIADFVRGELAASG